MTARDYTQTAMSAWEKGNLFEAQRLLRESAAVWDDYISCQNLAVFYMLHGQVRENGTACGASKYALRLLLRSRERKRTAINSLWLGRYYYKARRYTEAAHFFHESDSIKSTWQAAYSRGAALYLDGHPEEALAAYQRARTGCAAAFAGQPATAYFFALLPIDIQAASSQLQARRQCDKIDPLDDFLMLFFSGDKSGAAKQAEILLRAYVLELPALAMVYECLCVTMDEGQAAALLNDYSACFADFPDCGHRLRQLEEIMTDRAARAAAIREFQFIPILPDSCGIIGCPVHGNHE